MCVSPIKMCVFFIVCVFYVLNEIQEDVWLKTVKSTKKNVFDLARETGFISM